MDLSEEEYRKMTARFAAEDEEALQKKWPVYQPPKDVPLDFDIQVWNKFRLKLWDIKKSIKNLIFCGR